MTNAEKYLKDGVVHEFSVEFNKYMKKQGYAEEIFQDIVLFLATPIQPTLTEDERVILRNINSIHNVIGRNRDGNIQLMCKEPKIKDCIWHINLSCYNHLFQFIKERRRI